MNKLEIARSKINKIDKELAKLFEERMLVAEEVADYKREMGLPVSDVSREDALIEKNLNYIEKEELKKYYVNFQRDVIKISRNYQRNILQGMNVAFSEIEGAFAHIAADRISPDSNLLAFPSFTADAVMTININLENNGYDIVLERGAIKKVSDWLNLNRKVLIVTDSGVPEIYSKTVADLCKKAYIYTVPQGESSKSFQCLQALCAKMLENSFTRSDCIVAVGGGVVGDLAGFAASVYMRGIDFYNIPTTVLSQVDSSIGGKVAVNYDGVKNVIGAFYQPKKVIIDPEVLSTLSARQISNGLAESVKMGLTANEQLFRLFESENPFEKIDEIIYMSLLVKKQVVEKDEKESGLRKVLNFGHTIGHGFESEQKGGLFHGECVALGMLYMCSDTVRDRLVDVLQKLNLPTEISFNKKEVLRAIEHDKKSVNKGVSTVFVPKIGSFEFRDLTLKQIEEML